MTSVFLQPVQINTNQFATVMTNIDQSAQQAALSSITSTANSSENCNQKYIEEIENLRRQVRYIHPWALCKFLEPCNTSKTSLKPKRKNSSTK